MRGPHICIPRIGANIKKKDVFYVFKKLNVGKIMNVTIIKLNRKNYNMCFVYINKWKKSERVNNMLETIMDGGCFKVMYDFPCFWKCYLYKEIKEREYEPKKKKVVNEVIINDVEDVEDVEDKGSEEEGVVQEDIKCEEDEEEGVVQEDKKGVESKNEVMMGVSK